MSTSNEPDSWMLYKRIIIKEIAEFDQISMQFHFKMTKNGKEPF